MICQRNDNKIIIIIIIINQVGFPECQGRREEFSKNNHSVVKSESHSSWVITQSIRIKIIFNILCNKNNNTNNVYVSRSINMRDTTPPYHVINPAPLPILVQPNRPEWAIYCFLLPVGPSYLSSCCPPSLWKSWGKHVTRQTKTRGRRTTSPLSSPPVDRFSIMIAGIGDALQAANFINVIAQVFICHVYGWIDSGSGSGTWNLQINQLSSITVLRMLSLSTVRLSPWDRREMEDSYIPTPPHSSIYRMAKCGLQHAPNGK